MSSVAIRGPGVTLPTPVPLYPASINTGSQYLPNVSGTNVIDLPSGSAITIPAGQFNIQLGKYTTLQVQDPVIPNFWRDVSCGPGQIDQFDSDGINYRIANLTGCPVGAAITNAGSGYTSAPSVTASGHNSTWIAYLGGYVTSAACVSGSSGTGFSMLPLVEIAAPLAGVQATATAALNGSGVGTITINNAGAGYASAPAVTIFPNPFDPNIGTIVNAKATAVITGSGQVAAILCLTNGSGNQTTVPTLVISGGGGASAAATAVMCFTMTSASITSAGSGYFSNAYFTTIPTQTTGSTTAFAQPYIEQGLVNMRQAIVTATVSGSGLVNAVVFDGGIFETAAPGTVVVGQLSGTVMNAAVLSFTVGGVTDTVFITPA